MTRTLKQIPAGRDVYSLALERTADLLARHDHALVLFSGGKDSSAVLEVALEVLAGDPKLAARHLPLRAVFIDEEAIPFETEDYVRRVFSRGTVAGEWYCVPVKHRNACSRAHPWWWPWAPEDRDRWCRPLPPEAITELDGFPVEPASARLTTVEMNGLLAPPERGNTVLLMGIRAQESLTRRRMVTVRKVDNYLAKFDEGTSRGNLYKGYPIYDWTTEDVWTLPALRGQDYNRAYDRLEMAGVSRSLQRCSPAFGEEPLQKLHTYAACFPDVWEKMAERVPGVGAAVRYALTELYSYHGRPEKPAGMTWPDFIRHYLSQFGDKDAAIIASRIRQEIGNHYAKTSHPILASAPHPDSGVSWDWLLMLAMRGDFKGRKQPGGRIQTIGGRLAHPRYWHRYAREMADTIASGAWPEIASPVAAPADPLALIPDYAREAEAE